MKIAALFYYALNLEHIFAYTEVKDNDEFAKAGKANFYIERAALNIGEL